MYTKAWDYLRPIHRIATLCGTFPDQTLFSPKACLLYRIYSLTLLCISAYSGHSMMIFHFNYYKDIVCFTVLVTDVTTFMFHAASVVTPITLNAAYRKLFKRLDQAERLIHSLNIAQKQRPSNLQMCAWILLAVSAILFFWYSMNLIDTIPAVMTLGSLVNYLIFLSFTLQFVSIMSVIESKFVSVNWHLEYLNNKCPVYLSSRDRKTYIKNKVHGAQAVSYTHLDVYKRQPPYSPDLVLCDFLFFFCI